MIGTGAEHEKLGVGRRQAVHILKVAPLGSCAGLVKADDILLEIDGKEVSEVGEIEFRGHERLDFSYVPVLQ